MYVYDHAGYDKGECKMPECKDKLFGTRFSKSKSAREPWKPNNPAKKGHNKTMNKMHYYHQTLYYKPTDESKYHEEKVWMYKQNLT